MKKIQTSKASCWMSPKDTDRIGNSVGPDQALRLMLDCHFGVSLSFWLFSSKVFWFLSEFFSGSTLFAQPCLKRSKIGNLQITCFSSFLPTTMKSGLAVVWVVYLEGDDRLWKCHARSSLWRMARAHSSRDMGAFFNANTQNRRSHREEGMCLTDACLMDLLQVKNQFKHHDNREREVRQLSHYSRTDSPPIHVRSIFFVKKIFFFFFFVFFFKKKIRVGAKMLGTVG